MLQQTLAVFLVLGLLLAALWLLQRKGLAALNFVAGSRSLNRGKRETRMRVMERVVLTPQHSLHLVSLQGRLILFATSPSGCRPVPAAQLGLPGDEKKASFLENGAAC